MRGRRGGGGFRGGRRSGGGFRRGGFIGGGYPYPYPVVYDVYNETTDEERRLRAELEALRARQAPLAGVGDVLNNPGVKSILIVVAGVFLVRHWLR